MKYGNTIFEDVMAIRNIRVIKHLRKIYTCKGIAAKDGRHVQDEDLSVIEDGALVYEVMVPAKNTLVASNASLIDLQSRLRRSTAEVTIPSKIIWVGATADLPEKYNPVGKSAKKDGSDSKSADRIEYFDAELKLIAFPGLVDCHTHLVFAGDRASEFAARCGGATYEEIAAKGGGILTTVNATRAASEDELLKLATDRVYESRTYGVRTLEIKSGYGLNAESEIKCLKVANQLKSIFPDMDFSITCLAAHAFPKDIARDEYMRVIREDILPLVAREKLADTVDVFMDKGYYTADETRVIVLSAKTLGLDVRLHADELQDTDATSIAVDSSALSADHLLKISPKNISKLAKSTTVAVLLPSTAFYLKEKHAPARTLLDAGARVALSSDFNPGTSMTLNLCFVMTLGALYLGMTKSEIMASVTYNAACALGRQADLGSLEVGKKAQFVLSPYENFESSYYRLSYTPDFLSPDDVDFHV